MIPPGNQTVLVYPEVAVVDSYLTLADGSPGVMREAGTTPVTLPGVWVYPVTSIESQSLGQQVGTVCEIVADTFPGGAWAKVVTDDGREWDVLGEPRVYDSGFTGTKLSAVYIKARSPLALT